MNLPRSHHLIIAVLLALAPIAALAQSATDPIATVREMYRVNREVNPTARDPNALADFDAGRLFTTRLRTLYEAADARARATGDAVAGLDFDIRVANNDFEDGFERTVRYRIVRRSRARAEVRVTFRGLIGKELRYSLAFERGAWRIDDVRSIEADAWVWSDLLREGARE